MTTPDIILPESETAILPSGNGEDVSGPQDPFANLEALRNSQTFDRIKTKRPFTKCAIRKPRIHEFFQSHPTWRLETMLFALKEEMSDEWYLPFGSDVIATLDGPSLYNVCIFVWINRKKVVCIWPVRLAGADGRVNPWHESAYDAFASHAVGQWTTMAAGDGGYDIEHAENEDLPAPEWPDLPLNEILRVAFKGRVIDNLDHPLFETLRGAS